MEAKVVGMWKKDNTFFRVYEGEGIKKEKHLLL